ncbi:MULTISPECIES: hypothetical protein [Streptomyces]|uniref:hypothetical protein n=1 Tax=Streptomyces TaxID=1883 RepID=UPI001E63A7C9|nr:MULTISPECIES: hypothetical protein [Streptomyces]UFQ15733.1 hypothetical protein J2N69_12390 [Streptomyces huasconensis]WCL85336.1 hypothetical protein PPN52_12400 [Streptomyces sp. JCM 35825]
MSFGSKMPPEKRAELSDLVIAHTKTTQELSDEHEVPRKTIESWVQKRRRELGIPLSSRGGDRSLTPSAIRKIEKEREGRKAAEAKAESLSGELTVARAQLARLRETLCGMQVTLEYYMRQRPTGGDATL